MRPTSQVCTTCATTLINQRRTDRPPRHHTKHVHANLLVDGISDLNNRRTDHITINLADHFGPFNMPDSLMGRSRRPQTLDTVKVTALGF